MYVLIVSRTSCFCPKCYFIKFYFQNEKNSQSFASVILLFDTGFLVQMYKSGVPFVGHRQTV